MSSLPFEAHKRNMRHIRLIRENSSSNIPLLEKKGGSINSCIRMDIPPQVQIRLVLWRAGRDLNPLPRDHTQNTMALSGSFASLNNIEIEWVSWRFPYP